MARAKNRPGRKGSGRGAPGKSRDGKGPDETADRNATSRPNDWDKAISAAYLRSLGQTQSVAAETAGVCERTVAAWEHSPWWPEAQKEAHDRWLSGIVEKTKVAISDALDPQTDAVHPLTGEVLMDGDGKPIKQKNDPRVRTDAAKYVADRMIAELAPPKQRVAHTASVDSTDLSKLTDEELEQYQALMKKAAE